MKSYLALGAFSVILAGTSGAALAQREYTAPPVPQQRQLPQGTEKPAPETKRTGGRSLGYGSPGLLSKALKSAAGTNSSCPVTSSRRP